MSPPDVVVAGGGPTGLMLAAELTLAGTEVLIVERRSDQTVDGSRAGGLQAHTLEVLDQRGVGHRFVAAGQLHPFLGYGGTLLSLADQPTRHPHTLALWQGDIERILTDWVLGDLGVRIVRDREVVGLTQDTSRVDVEVSEGSTLRAAYLVGCDGGRSTVRKAAGIAFPGLHPSTSWMIAQVDMDEPVLGLRPEGAGIGPADREARLRRWGARPAVVVDLVSISSPRGRAWSWSGATGRSRSDIAVHGSSTAILARSRPSGANRSDATSKTQRDRGARSCVCASEGR